MIRLFQTIIHGGLGILLFILLGLGLLVISTINRNKVYPYIAFLCKKMLGVLGVKLEVEGVFPKDEHSYILMFNHSSFVEMFIVPYILNGQKFTVVSAAKNMSIPLLGTLLRVLKAVPVSKGNTKKSITNLNKANKMLEEGYHLLIAPEGTRSLDGKLNKFKKGGFHMAIDTKTKIVPVGLQGAYEFKPKKRWYLQPGIVKIKIGTPISVELYDKKNITSLLEKVENEIRKLSGQ